MGKNNPHIFSFDLTLTPLPFFSPETYLWPCRGEEYILTEWVTFLMIFILLVTVITSSSEVVVKEPKFVYKAIIFPMEIASCIAIV